MAESTESWKERIAANTAALRNARETVTRGCKRSIPTLMETEDRHAMQSQRLAAERENAAIGAAVIAEARAREPQGLVVTQYDRV